MSATSYLVIDPGASQFRMDDLFNFVDAGPIIGRLAQRSYDGTMRLTDKYYKDAFTVNFPKLTFAQMSAVNTLLRQTGTNFLHTVQYAYRDDFGNLQLRKYDGTTTWTAGYGINDDVQRLRNKVYAVKFSFPHWPQVSNVFSGSIQFEEG